MIIEDPSHKKFLEVTYKNEEGTVLVIRSIFSKKKEL